MSKILRMSAVRLLLTFTILHAGSGLALGHGSPPKETPIDRLLENLDKMLKERPDDAVLHYTVGRAHALALEFKSRTIFVWDPKDRIPDLVDRGWTRLRFQRNGESEEKKAAPEPTAAELREHLSKAIEHLNRSIELDPRPARVHLALASALEAGAPLAGTIEVFPRCPVNLADRDMKKHKYIHDCAANLGKDDEAVEALRKALLSPPFHEGRTKPRDLAATLLLQRIHDPDEKVRQAARGLLLEDWKEQIAEEYFVALTLALPADSRLDEQPMWGSLDSWISYEAAKCFLTAVKSRGVRKDERIRVEVALATVRAFDNLPRPRGITPVIVAPSEGADLVSCLAPSTRVCFDLDGSGRVREWPWVAPETGILVWDPERTGQITSGRQLFGSVTWWIFFTDGYQALRALDDDGDGELRSEELRGIGVWFDRDSNGISDPGEVLTAEEFGIERLAVRASEVVEGCPANRTGALLQDGRVLPTFDWIPPEEASAAP